MKYIFLILYIFKNTWSMYIYIYIYKISYHRILSLIGL